MKFGPIMNILRLTVTLILLSPIVPANSADLSMFHAEAPGASNVSLDHSGWTALLTKYIDERAGLNYFRYGEVSPPDLELLEEYIEALQAVTVTDLTAGQQFAYWINLYNALTVWVILDHYPVDSIRDISYGLLTRGPWKEALVTVQDVDLSLDNIEHDILRPVFSDSRIHYAVNCASIGCPNLQPAAFTADNLEEQLEKAAAEYINHPRGARVEDEELIVSKIYDWYRDDFGESDLDVVDHLAEYASGSLADALADFDEIDDYEYDWALNE